MILSKLKKALGQPYIWGGNWGRGILEIKDLYKSEISRPLENSWTLSGVDCSGLLYEATNGFIPRNTSDLMHFGDKISSLENIKPLDIIIWPGHVIILLEPNLVIESLLGKGVIETPLHDRLQQIAEKPFVIRRLSL